MGAARPLRPRPEKSARLVRVASVRRWPRVSSPAWRQAARPRRRPKPPFAELQPCGVPRDTMHAPTCRWRPAVVTKQAIRRRAAVAQAAVHSESVTLPAGLTESLAAAGTTGMQRDFGAGGGGAADGGCADGGDVASNASSQDEPLPLPLTGAL